MSSSLNSGTHQSHAHRPKGSSNLAIRRKPPTHTSLITFVAHVLEELPLGYGFQLSAARLLSLPVLSSDEIWAELCPDPVRKQVQRWQSDEWMDKLQTPEAVKKWEFSDFHQHMMDWLSCLVAAGPTADRATWTFFLLAASWLGEKGADLAEWSNFTEKVHTTLHQTVNSSTTNLLSLTTPSLNNGIAPLTRKPRALKRLYVSDGSMTSSKRQKVASQVDSEQDTEASSSGGAQEGGVGSVSVVAADACESGGTTGLSSVSTEDPEELCGEDEPAKKHVGWQYVSDREIKRDAAQVASRLEVTSVTILHGRALRSRNT